ncbi:Serine/threonine protein kinase [Parasponia andersonii]|uniref:Serine/threonine protein kinase n=1 Tax=Parasponia andersonii TaxID=3476 RepID=A0A2P5E5J9_PARAD|nr:Serine/threonine protein kinase [Parasponia andersonii]
MATKNPSKLILIEQQEEELKIPVFTVLKNGAILKNIFIVNASPPPPISELKPMMTALENPDNPNQEHQEILVVGRHPDCNIMLTHPSISRFHLQIVSNPSLQKLSVIDLSSVHGTWVSEKKIDPSVRVELKEGDSLRIGGSSRVYRLHWIPLSRAYDFETLYVSASDIPMPEEKEDEIEVEGYRDENSSMIENIPVEEQKNNVTVEMKAQEEICEVNNHSLVESMSSLVSDESLVLTVRKEIPSAPPVPENPIFSLFDENDELAESPPKDIGGHSGISGPFNRPFGTADSGIEGVCLVPEGSECHEDEKQGLEASFVAEVVCDIVLPESSSRGPEVESNHLANWDSSFSIVKDENVDLASETLEETESQSLVWKELEQTESSSSLDAEVSDETEYQETDIENLTPEALYDVESLSPQGKQENSAGEQTSNSLVDFISACSGGIPSASERTEDQRVSMKDHEQRDVLVEYSPSMTESVNSSLPARDVVPVLSDDKENQTPRSLCAEGGLPQWETVENSPMRSYIRRSFGSIWSRRGKPASVTPLRTGKSRLETMLVEADSENEQHIQEGTEDKSIPKEILSCLNGEEEAIFTPDKENFTPNTLLSKSLKKKGKSASAIQLRTGKSRVETMLAGVDYQDEHHAKENTLDRSIFKKNFSCLNGEEEEIFTPDKENFIPNSLLLRSLKKKDKIEEVKHPKPFGTSSLKVASSLNMHPEEDLNASSNKENQTLRILQERKLVKQPSSENQAGVEQELMVNKRVPFQSLTVNAVGKSRPETLCPSSATRSCSSVNYTRTVDKKDNPVLQGKRGWTMVVDTTTLLSKEARKSMQLLQGLRGTRLIIPRMVIMELDSLKRRGSLFRRKTEACLVLEWIEKCMTETTWWIHVQTSVEDARLTAPTPPATPRSPFSQGSGGKMKSDDGQLVLLSEDVTLKIKAMAEGLICETVQEFRDSLMNPFSERFMWVDSSPRGQTWSVLDDVVLREKYNRCPLKKSSKGESAKGLKLILLHNSHYGQRTLIS